MSIFEVCDTSNDECCFPIGYFGTLERAKKEIRDKMLNGFNISTHTDDHEKIEVFELSIGWGDVRKSVFCIAAVLDILIIAKGAKIETSKP